jgi:aminopeptidase N
MQKLSGYSCFLTVILLIFFSRANAINKNEIIKKNYDVLHYNISVNVDLDRQYIRGKVNTTIIYTSKSDTIYFDSENITIYNASINGKKAGFKVNDKILKIIPVEKYKLNDTLIISVEYDAFPKQGKGIYFFKPENKLPYIKYQCYSQGEEQLNHYWFPCYDYPDDRVTSEMYITVKNNFKAVSNGNLISVKDDTNSTKTYHWKMEEEHVAYLISFVVGEYEEIKDNYGNIPLSYYVYKEKLNDAKLIFPKTPEMIKYFENLLSFKYPWNSYSQIIMQDFFGGMENTTLTNLIDDIPDRKNFYYDEKYTHFYEMIMAHELTHQWFGDYITCKRFEDLWLNEGFAEYLTGMYKSDFYGKTEGNIYFYDEFNTYKNISAKEAMPTVSYKSNNVYQKGALILKMLKSLTSEKEFWKIMNTYLNRYQNKSIETSDFKKIVEEVTGKDYTLFFDQWLYKIGHPKYKVEKKYNEKNKELILKFTQTQKIDSIHPVFKTPMDIELYLNNKNEKKTVYLDSINKIIRFNNINENPKLVSIDPERNIIKEIVFEKTKPELIFQLLNSKSEIDRIEAADNLEKYNSEAEVFTVLKTAFLSDKSWKVRQTALYSIAKSNNQELAGLLMDHYKKEEHPNVRRDILHSLTNIKNDKKISDFLFKSIYDSSTSVVISAVQVITVYDSLKAFDTLLKFIDVESARNQIQEYVLGAMVKSKDERAIPCFKEYMFKARSNLARNSAFLGLVNLAKSHKELYDFFVENLKSDIFYFKRMSITALGNIGDKRAINILEEMNKTETNSFVKRMLKEALGKLNSQ